MQNQMLPNIIMYLTSTAAQVWAALMVFEVFLMRDLDSRRDSAVKEQWELAKIYWSPVIKNLIDPNPPTLRNNLNEFGLDPFTLERADTDKEIFLKFIKAIKEHKLIYKIGKAYMSLNMDAMNAKLAPIAEKIEELESMKGQPVSAFTWGGISILLNFILMALSGFCKSDNALWSLISFVLIGNSAVGIYIGRNCYKVLKLK